MCDPSEERESYSTLTLSFNGNKLTSLPKSFLNLRDTTLRLNRNQFNDETIDMIEKLKIHNKVYSDV